MNNCINKYKSLPVQVKASFWFLICSFIQRGLSVITTPIFTRLLSTSEYGLFSVFSSWKGIVAIFVTLSLSAGVYTQGLIKFSDNRDVFSSSLQGLTTTLVVLWVSIYLINPGFWNKCFSLSTIQMFALFAVIWSSAAFAFWSAEQRVYYKYKALVIISLLLSILKPALGIVLVINADDKVTARILGIVIIDFIAGAGFYTSQMHRGKVFYNKTFWKYALHFNIPLIPHYLSQTVLNSADRIMIERMVGASEAGIYSLAYSISSIMVFFNSALMDTISPWFYQRIKEKDYKGIPSIAYSTLIGIAAVNILLIAFAPEAVKIFAPEEYYSAIWIIPPVAMSVYFMYSYDLFAKYAFYYEKTFLIMLGSVIGALLNVVLNYIFIGRYGYQAAAYTTLFCYIVYAVVHYILMNRICDTYCEGIKIYDIRIILLISVAFVFLGFVLMATYNFWIIRYSAILLFLFVVLLYKNKITLAVKWLVNNKKER